MSDPRFLLIRLGSLGDIINALPAAAALRDTFPESQIDWAVEPKWKRLLEGNSDLNQIVSVDRKSAGGIAGTIKRLRAAKYTCAIDFQALYKSALLGFFSGAPRRIGFTSDYAREGFAARFYTDRLNPHGPHKVDHNLTLVQSAGAAKSKPRYPIAVLPEEESEVARELEKHNLKEFFVMSPGGGWRSKCWPPERYGQLQGKILARYGWRGVIGFGPGEENLAREVLSAAGDSAPLAMPMGLGPLMALLRRAKFLVSADTGPLHLACALGVPVVGLYGPTDPSRNGPFSADDVVVRNLRLAETDYRRGKTYARSMLSISVEQVFDAVQRRLETRS
jgi:ADP-heptose:LPS heptosyltransferase